MALGQSYTCKVIVARLMLLHEFLEVYLSMTACYPQLLWRLVSETFQVHFCLALKVCYGDIFLCEANLDVWHPEIMHLLLLVLHHIIFTSLHLVLVTVFMLY